MPSQRPSPFVHCPESRRASIVEPLSPPPDPSNLDTAHVSSESPAADSTGAGADRVGRNRNSGSVGNTLRSASRAASAGSAATTVESTDASSMLTAKPAGLLAAGTAGGVGIRLVGGVGTDGRNDSQRASSRTRAGPRTTRERRTGSRMLAVSGQTPPGLGGAYSASFSRIRDRDLMGPRCTSTVPGPSENMHISSSPPMCPSSKLPAYPTRSKRVGTGGRSGGRGSPRTEGGGASGWGRRRERDKAGQR
mmetsp:Transcript_2834/g.7738  ORF Transcript_2834/g.7738 Transcript_2834/m.7738 type:complete len:250 (+) Transcript_2834:898-1647(+)